MTKKIVPLLLVIAMMGMTMGVVGLLLSDNVSASSHSATRSFSPSEVTPGGEVSVTIAVADYGQFGGVAETIPAGFTYVDGSSNVTVVVNGRNLEFTLYGETSVTYRVNAADTADSHSFSGNLIDDQGDRRSVGGSSSVTVAAEVTPTPTDPHATRSFSPSQVTSGGQVSVTVAVANYGQFGGVAETIPAGFTYVDGSSNVAVAVDGRNLEFTLYGETRVTYRVNAADTAGSHSFSGDLIDDQGAPHSIGGSSSVTVQGAPPPPPPPPPPTLTDRPGMVSFSMDMPKVDAAVTATLSDPDDGVTGTTWQWSRSDTMDGTYTNIANATSASYTPVDDDVDKYLKAMASYTDTHRSNRTAEAKTANAVGSATTGSALGDQYDSVANGGNGDGQLDTPEMLKAVRDYFAQESTITVSQMLELVRIYFAG